MITKIVSLVMIAVLRSEYPVRHNHTQLSVPNLEPRVCRKTRMNFSGFVSIIFSAFSDPSSLQTFCSSLQPDPIDDQKFFKLRS